MDIRSRKKRAGAVDQGDREEDDHGRHGRHGDGEADLARAANGRVTGAEAAAIEPVNVLGHHDGVVDEKADADHQAQQREEVERLAREVHHRETDHDAERDRPGHHDHQPEAAKEEEEHDGGDDAADQPRVEQGRERLVDRLALVEDGDHLEAREARVLDHALVLGVDALGDLARVRVALLEDDHCKGGLAVGAHAVGLLGFLVLDRRDVPEANPGCDVELFELLQGPVLGDGAEEELARPVVDRTGGEREVVVGHPRRELVDVQPGGGRAFAIELDDDLFLFEPVGRDVRDAVDALEALDDAALHQVVDVGRVRVHGDAVDLDGDRVVVVLLHEDPVDLVREDPPRALDPVPHLAVRNVHVRTVLEAQVDDRATGERPGADSRHAADGRELLLEGDDDLLEDLLGRRVLVGHVDPEEGVVEALGDQLDRDEVDRDRADDERRHHQDQHRDPAAQREAREGAVGARRAGGHGVTERAPLGASSSSALASLRRFPVSTLTASSARA